MKISNETKIGILAAFAIALLILLGIAFPLVQKLLRA